MFFLPLREPPGGRDRLREAAGGGESSVFVAVSCRGSPAACVMVLDYHGLSRATVIRYCIRLKSPIVTLGSDMRIFPNAKGEAQEETEDQA